MTRHMKWVLLAILSTTPLTVMSAVESLEITLRSPPSKQRAESADVIVSVTNRSDRPLLLPRSAGALDTVDGYLMGDVFKVISSEGDAASYSGRAIRVATRNRDRRFRTIEPGQTVTSEVSLATNYDIRSGAYNVTYEQNYIEVGAWNPDGATYEQARSNVLRIVADQSLIDRARLPD